MVNKINDDILEVFYNLRSENSAQHSAVLNEEINQYFEESSFQNAPLDNSMQKLLSFILAEKSLITKSHVEISALKNKFLTSIIPNDPCTWQH